MAKRARKPARFPVEVITWLDHVGPASAPDYAPKSMTLVVRQSVGWVVYEDHERVVLAGTWDEKGAHDMTALGVGLITRRDVIKAGE